MILAIIITLFIGGATGAQLNEDYGIAPVKHEQTEK